MAAVLSRATAEAHALAVEAQQRADQTLFDFDAMDLAEIDGFGDLLAEGELMSMVEGSAAGEFGN